MKELNELVELANHLDGESWEYSRTTPYSRGYITGRNGRTIVQTSDGEVPASVCRFIEMADPATILAIAEAFRVLEQRAEAAEARANNLNDGWLNAITERDEARAKLAELEKQEPIGYHSTDARTVFRVWPDADGKICVPVYSRPVPAVSLAELVPEKYNRDAADYDEDSLPDIMFANGFDACRAAILRNIEEAK